MEANPYLIIIILSLLVIISYGFNQISKFTKIPAVIFLIATGIGIQELIFYMGFELPDLSQPLRLLGVVGLMMIVLEGALDLHIHRNKLKLLFAALGSSIVILAITNSLIAYILFYFLRISYLDAFLSAIPLSVVSSAIVIPSVHQLLPAKKEFMIVEATLSDIFGIMLFAFWIYQPEPDQTRFEAISWNIIISVGVSIILSYLLVYVFQKIKTKIKFFLFLAILALLFSVGEYFHYSALLIILIFGVILNNTHAFFRGFLSKLINKEAITGVRREFITITNETAFLIRTFFFVVFGITLNLDGLLNIQAIIISIAVMLVIYITRALNLKVFVRSSIYPQILIAPRGLVTILLFNKVVDYYGKAPFDESVIALVIVGTNLIMMFGLMVSGSEKKDILRKEITGENLMLDEQSTDKSST